MGKDGYKDTVMVALTAEDGTQVTVGVPSTLPSDERAEVLRTLYKVHVMHPGGYWKGVAVAIVPVALADDVADAMDFMGSVVDLRTAPQSLSSKRSVHGDKGRIIAYPVEPGQVLLYSRGYWAHGF